MSSPDASPKGLFLLFVLFALLLIVAVFNADAALSGLGPMSH
jgi:hypothetical protein